MSWFLTIECVSTVYDHQDQYETVKRESWREWKLKWIETKLVRIDLSPKVIR